jgi:hypothetical protein
MASRGPTWKELRAWCAYEGKNFDRVREWLVRHAAEVECDRTLVEMKRLAAEKPTSARGYAAHGKAWDANMRAHQRALEIAYPGSTALAKNEPLEE